MTRKEPRLQATPEALARAVVRKRPRAAAEVRVFVEEEAAQRTARRLAKVFPQVEIVPWQNGHAVLADGCPYLTSGRVSLQPMPTG